MIKEPKVSIIIPFYGNQFDCVIAGITSIYDSYHKNLNIILIDNGSKSNTSEYVSKIFPKVKLVISEINTGVCGGRNLGIDNLNGDEDFVIFFDSDQVVDKKMISELIKPFSIDSSIGITSPKIYYHPDYIDSKIKSENESDTDLIKRTSLVWSAGTDINMSTGQVIFYGGEDRFNEDRYISIAPGVLCCSRESLKKIGKFDIAYVSVYEDSDFCFRAKKLGYKIYFCNNAWAWHKIYFDPKGSEKKLLTRLFFIGRNRILFMKKFAPNIKLFYLFLPVYVFYYLFISLRNLQLKPFIEFLKGTYSGLTYEM